MKRCLCLKIKQKKYQKYLFCSKSKKYITFRSCQNCPFKEYKRPNIKRDTNNKSIMLTCAIFIDKNTTVSCFNYKIYGYHKHHIFGGKNRNNSERYGLFVWMNPNNHTYSNQSVHQNTKLNETLKKMAQKAFMEEYPNLDFVSIFGQNYLERRKKNGRNAKLLCSIAGIH